MSDLPVDALQMSSSRPYMIRAIHAWITDNGLTPYIVVDAELPMVTVPVAHINDGKIVLNCGYDAVSSLSIENDWISFSARFSGVSESVSFPPSAVNALYARENGQGMVFPEEDVQQASTALNSDSVREEHPVAAVSNKPEKTTQASDNSGKGAAEKKSVKKDGKPALTLVKS
jgi:stringent starvation protein B